MVTVVENTTERLKVSKQLLINDFFIYILSTLLLMNSSMDFNYKEKWWVPVINISGNEKSRESKIEKAVEQENEHGGGVGGKLVTGCSIYIGTNSLKAGKYNHTEKGGQDQGLTANFINQGNGD